MKTLILDIETSPNLAYVWDLHSKRGTSVGMMKEASEIIAFGAKWRGEKKVHYADVYTTGRAAIVVTAHDLINEADVLVHYNGQSFDIPHLNREFLEWDLLPPSPVQHIDLWRVVSRTFNFPSNKMDYVTKRLGLGGKAPTGGFDLWRRCLQGDAKAWRQMRKYNIQDVKLTEELYGALLPWIPNHPHAGVIDGKGAGCPNCGGTSLQRRGFAHTRLSTFQRYQCQECGAWSRSRAREKSSPKGTT